ncbi:MAG: hypothetical protein NC131_12735 [Roseburia sp.]|nr:hypothetical protein [Roseburia sp.]
MEVNFKFKDAAKVDPIRIEQVFAEKPGGGLVENPQFEIAPTTAVGEKDGKFAPIKAYRLVSAVVADDTTIKVEKGSGVAVGDIIAHGKKGVACTAVDNTPADHDLVTVTLGVEIANDTVLYQAKAADASKAEPIYTPVYVTGNRVPANEGDFRVRLINGANLRKETACIASEVAALLPLITLV